MNNPAYNMIAARGAIWPVAHAEPMSYVSEYARGLLADYPTRAGGGSCIVIHIQKPTATGTGGCVALPEPAVLAIVPRPALFRSRLPG